jgi:hypothetical protein
VLFYRANPDSPFHAAAKTFFIRATKEGWAKAPPPLHANFIGSPWKPDGPEFG